MWGIQVRLTACSRRCSLCSNVRVLKNEPGMKCTPFVEHLDDLNEFIGHAQGIISILVIYQ